MAKNSAYHPVNWMDGMKINKNHFVDEENAFTYQVSESIKARITDQNYGLLPSGGDKSNLNIGVELENNSSISIKIKSCKAITFGGYFININEADNNAIAASLNFASAGNDNDSIHYIVVSANPYKRIPTGEVDPEEEPLRYPYTTSEYKIHLVPFDEIGPQPLSNHLILGKINVQNGQPRLVEDYIPATTSLSSYDALVEVHSTMNAVLGKLELNTIGIIQKVVQKEQQHKLALMVKYISENILGYLNGNLYRFKKILLNQAPIELVDSISILAKTFKNTIDTRQGCGKEELVNYFAEWCDLNQGKFETLMSDVIGLEYNHIDIRTSLDKCLKFLKEIDTLFQKLNELDYIGRKSDQGMIVKEEVRIEQHKKTKNFFGI
ncbi:MAG TPA: hypothetical protein VF691_13540 [Cytophagaceae bacterium]|jgi:hypothetical protein